MNFKKLMLENRKERKIYADFAKNIADKCIQQKRKMSARENNQFEDCRKRALELDKTFNNFIQLMDD